MIDYSVNVFNVLTPSALVAIIGYMFKRWVNGTTLRIEALEKSAIKKEEYGKDYQILREDIGKLDIKLALFQNNFMAGGGIYKAFQEEIQRTIKDNAYLLGQRE